MAEPYLHVAIDGPAGAGKSTVARAVARHFKITYLDTGAMYRALGYKALLQGISTQDEQAVSQLMDETCITVQQQDGVQRVFLDGQEVGEQIRTPAVAQAASDVSKWPAVRRGMVALQQRIAKDMSVVMDGRDIGTHVMPDAPHKFFLTASVEARARRRLKDLAAMGQEKDLETMCREIEMRDYQDSHRDFAPLRQAPDACFIDTTNMTQQQVIDAVIAQIEKKRGTVHAAD